MTPTNRNFGLDDERAAAQRRAAALEQLHYYRRNPEPPCRVNRTVNAIIAIAALAVLFAMVFFSMAGRAQSLTDAPQAKFWTPTRTAATVANFGLRTYDAAETCHSFAHIPGWREAQLNTQSCRGVTLYSAGFAAGALGLEYALHRSGHHRLAKIPQWLSAAGAGEGIIYSRLHTR